MNSSFSLQALRRDQPHQQRAVRGVHRRVERRELVAHRQLVAVLLDERADVVADERHREAGERPGHRVARRERRGVVVHRDRLFVAGDHHDVVVRLALHRALRPQVLEVGVRVGDERVVDEEVDRVEVGHRRLVLRGACRGCVTARSASAPGASASSCAPEVDRDRRRPSRTALRARIVRLRKRWNGWSVVKPIPASTCWQCVATVAAVRPAVAFASAAVMRVRLVGRGAERRVERLDRDERLGEPVAHGLERRDRPAELHPFDRVGAREVEHRPARARRSGARPRAGRRATAVVPRGARRAGSRPVTPRSTRTTWKPASGSMPCTARTVRVDDGHGDRARRPLRRAHDEQLGGGRDAGRREARARARGRRRCGRAGATRRTAAAAPRGRARGAMPERGHDDVVEHRSRSRSSRRAR